MPKYTFHLGVTLRCYGNVEVEAETVEAALPLLTADYVGEHIEITETTTDSGQDLAVIDVSDADTGEELGDWGGHPLPSPYDPPDFLPLLRQIQADCANCMGRERELARIILDRVAAVVPPHDPATKAEAEGQTNG